MAYQRLKELLVYNNPKLIYTFSNIGMKLKRIVQNDTILWHSKHPTYGVIWQS